MIVFSVIFQLLIGFCCELFDLTIYNDFYNLYQNTIAYNLLIGFLIGFAYMICELPNSFVKSPIAVLLCLLQALFFSLYHSAPDNNRQFCEHSCRNMKFPPQKGAFFPFRRIAPPYPLFSEPGESPFSRKDEPDPW